MREKRTRTELKPRGTAAGAPPEKIVIIGGGAAGFAAAEKLRREKYQGSIVVLSDDNEPPVDRPNLSKDYLAGTAPEDWLPLRTNAFYSENDIDLRLNAHAINIDLLSRHVALADGGRVSYDQLLLATGAEPQSLSIPGADLPHVLTLRSLGNCRAIIEYATVGGIAVVIGASFIGLEVAASLRARGIEVHVVAPDKRPMERVLGVQIGDFVRSLHEQHGVIFHLEDMATYIDSKHVMLKSGKMLRADFVVVGIGVRPRVDLARKAGLSIDRGIVVDAYLETSVPGIFAAGDIARWPDRHTGEMVRVEHWIVAERQGQTAALNMLGHRQKYAAIPFFWSQHYDVPINYIGHAGRWDELLVDGEIKSRDCLISFRRDGQTLAVASIFRDMASLRAEVAMEKRLSL